MSPEKPWYISEFATFARRISARQKFRDLAGCKIPEPLTVTDDLNEFLGRLCAEYLHSDNGSRSQIRSLFQDESALWYLHEYIRFLIKSIEASAVENNVDSLLRTGLAAVSMTDLRPDFRDSLYELGYLFRAAQRAGIAHPMSHFRDIAQLSNGLRNPSTEEIIRTFDKSEVCRELRESREC